MRLAVAVVAAAMVNDKVMSIGLRIDTKGCCCQAIVHGWCCLCSWLLVSTQISTVETRPAPPKKACLWHRTAHKPTHRTRTRTRTCPCVHAHWHTFFGSLGEGRTWRSWHVVSSLVVNRWNVFTGSEPYVTWQIAPGRLRNGNASQSHATPYTPRMITCTIAHTHT